jgi:sugar phosphate permease
MVASAPTRLSSFLARRGVHYGWVIAGVSFLTLITAAGFRSTAGVLIVPLQDEFGWSRATISAAVSVNLVLYGLGGPFAAGLYDRIGVRRVIVSALVLIAVSSLVTTQMSTPWQLDVLWGVANGLATGAIGVTLAAVIANRWFVKRRGLVTGLLTASNATGQLVFLPLLAWIVDTRGWRSAVITVSLVALCIVLPLVALLLRDSPAELGLRPFGATVDDPPLPQQNPFGAAIRGLAAASRSRTFWLLSGSFFVCGATTNGLIGTHLIPASMDHGVSEVTAASLLATIGVFDLFGTLGSGWLTDRIDPRWLLFWYYGFRGLSLLALPFVIGSANLGLIAFAVFYGLDWVARASDGGDHGRDLRPRLGRRHVRLGVRCAPARSGDGRLGRGGRAHVARRLSIRVRDRGSAVARGIGHGDPDRPSHTRAAGAAPGGG